MESVGKRAREEASTPSAHLGAQENSDEVEARSNKRGSGVLAKAGSGSPGCHPEKECPSTGPLDSKDISELVGSRSQLDFCAAYAKQGVQVFIDDDNMHVLAQLRDEYKDDISGFFQFYIPAAQKILMPIAARCGFQESAGGAAAFLEHLKSYASKPEASKIMKEDVEFLCNVFRFKPRKVLSSDEAGSVDIDNNALPKQEPGSRANFKEPEEGRSKEPEEGQE